MVPGGHGQQPSQAAGRNWQAPAWCPAALAALAGSGQADSHSGEGRHVVSISRPWAVPRNIDSQAASSALPNLQPEHVAVVGPGPGAGGGAGGACSHADDRAAAVHTRSRNHGVCRGPPTSHAAPVPGKKLPRSCLRVQAAGTPRVSCCGLGRSGCSSGTRAPAQPPPPPLPSTAGRHACLGAAGEQPGHRTCARSCT